MTGRLVVPPGQDVRLRCTVTGSSGSLTQFIRQKVVANVFQKYSSTENLIISNNEQIIPQITAETPRYSIEVQSGNYFLVIKGKFMMSVDKRLLSP